MSLKKENDSVLGSHKGHEVLTTSIIVNKLGAGLSRAVGVQPFVVEAGEVAFVAVRVSKTKDRYDYVKDDHGAIVGVELVQVFDATAATFADEKLVGKAVAKMQAIIETVEAERKGQLQLGIVVDDDDDPVVARQVKLDVAHLANEVDEVFNPKKKGKD